MQNYSYHAVFEHGAATGGVQADDAEQAKEKVKAMYHGNQYDTKDAEGKPVVKQVVVTKVTVTPVKG